MKNKLLWGLFALLALIQGANMYLAPETLASVAKQNLGARKALTLALAAYHEGGREAMEGACSYPVEIFGYYHRCVVMGTPGSRDRDTIIVATYGDINAAWDTVGRPVRERGQPYGQGIILIAETIPLHVLEREVPRMPPEATTY